MFSESKYLRAVVFIWLHIVHLLTLRLIPYLVQTLSQMKSYTFKSCRVTVEHNKMKLPSEVILLILK